MFCSSCLIKFFLHHLIIEVSIRSKLFLRIVCMMLIVTPLLLMRDFSNPVVFNSCNQRVIIMMILGVAKLWLRLVLIRTVIMTYLVVLLVQILLISCFPGLVYLLGAQLDLKGYSHFFYCATARYSGLERH